MFAKKYAGQGKLFFFHLVGSRDDYGAVFSPDFFCFPLVIPGRNYIGQQAAKQDDPGN